MQPLDLEIINLFSNGSCCYIRDGCRLALLEGDDRRFADRRRPPTVPESGILRRWQLYAQVGGVPLSLALQ